MDVSAALLRLPLVPPGRCRALFAAAFGLAAASAVVALVPAVVVSVIAAVIFDGLGLGLNVMQVVFVGIIAVMFRLGLLLVARNTAGTATELLSQGLRGRAAVVIGALPLGVLGALPAGSLETILLDDVETLGHYTTNGLIDFIAAVAMLVAAAALLLAVDWRAGLASIVVTAAGALAMRASARGAPEIAAERAVRERLAASIFAQVRALALRLTLPSAPGAFDPLRAVVEDDRRAAHARLARAATRRAQRAAVAGAVPAAVVLLLAAFGAERADLAKLALFAVVGMRVSGALACVLRAKTVAAPAAESAARIAELLARPAVREGTTPVPDDATLRFENVSFAYPGPAGRPVLHGIDFVAEPGRITAIVGPSGSGKTTLTRLAVRLWDADDGRVTYGGVDVRAFPIDAFMQRVACVFQDVALLDDTLAANVKLGRPEASDDEMIRAATAAGAHRFISALPAGYRTVVGDRGLQLSRGERQRVQIARALLKDAPLIVLDEPTSSMDPATELEIQTALGTLLAGKTVLVVAHRLATIARADRIVVLDRDGRVEAQGAHRSLLAASPTYAALWNDYAATMDWAADAGTVAR